MASQTDETLPKDSRRAHWMRGLFMLLFVVIYNVAEGLAMLVALFQFVHTLVTGDANERLLAFGRHLSGYIYEVMRYLTYGTEERPYPFNPWPEPPDPDRYPMAGSGRQNGL